MRKKIISIAFILFLSFFIGEVLIRVLTPFYNVPLRAFVKEEAYRGARTALRVSHGAQIILREDDFKKDIDVVALGDSVVFGSLVEESEVWTTLLERKAGLKVLNLGTGSQGPCAYNYMLKIAFSNLSKPPSFVLYTIFANDVTEGSCSVAPSAYADTFIWEKDYKRNFKLRLRRYREWIFQHSLLYQIAKRLATFRHLLAGADFKPIYFKHGNFEFAFTPVSYWECLDLKNSYVAQEFERTLDKIKEARELTEKNGGRFILILMPFKEQVYTRWLVEEGLLPGNAYDRIYDSLYDKLFVSANEMDIKAVDLRAPFRKEAKQGKKLYWTLDGHLTPEGNELVALVLSDTVKEK